MSNTKSTSSNPFCESTLITLSTISTMSLTWSSKTTYFFTILLSNHSLISNPLPPKLIPVLSITSPITPLSLNILFSSSIERLILQVDVTTIFALVRIITSFKLSTADLLNKR